jgi:hypothetical protein
MTRLDFPFPQIATGDLDIAVLGQLPAANLPLSGEFEPGPPSSPDPPFLVVRNAEDVGSTRLRYSNHNSSFDNRNVLL